MKKNFTILIGLAVLIFIAVIYNMNNSFEKEMEEYHKEFDNEKTWTSTELNKKKTIKTTLTDNEAAYAAQQFVEKKLKVPSSADFDALFKSKITRNGKEYTVISHIESQNSFGAKVRSRYVAVIKRNSTGGVSLLDLVIE